MSSSDSEREVQRSSTILSLQDAAINTIVKNIGGYRELITEISPPMRKILFDEAMKRKREIGADQVWAALPYLDQNRTTESFSTKDFQSIFRLKGKKGEISGGCVSMEQFLQYLVEFVPNLQQLNIESPRGALGDDWDLFKKVHLEPLSNDLLLQMENLTHVIIFGVYIKFSGFVKVSSESKNLQLIGANKILVDIEPKSIKKILKTLEPKFDHQEYDTCKFPRKIGITLKWANACAPYREAIVSLSNNWQYLFPSLTKLQMMPMRYQGFDGTQSERTRLLRILRREGRTLKSLCLYDIRPELNITFNRIFEHCNDLESLELSASSLGHGDPITSFGQLKNLKWRRTFNEDCIRLDRILSAPHLQKIVIVAWKINLGDKETLLNQIRNRTILTQLTYIRIWVFEEYDEDLHEIASELRSLGVEVYIPRI